MVTMNIQNIRNGGSKSPPYRKAKDGLFFKAVWIGTSRATSYYRVYKKRLAFENRFGAGDQ